jgi:Flp pilus assembly protein CpaB
MRRHWPWVLSALCSLLFFGLFLSRAVPSEAKGTIETRPVVMLTKPILEPYTLITSEMLTVTQVPNVAVPNGAVQNPDEVVGKYSLYPLPSQLPLTVGLVVDGTHGRMGLRTSLSADERLAAVPVDLVGGAGGQVMAGDRVDLTVVWDPAKNGGIRLAETALQNLEVSVALNSTGGVIPPDGKLSPGQDPTERVPAAVLVKVTADQAVQLSYAVRFGYISLSLRNPSHHHINQTTGFNGPKPVR